VGFVVWKASSVHILPAFASSAHTIGGGPVLDPASTIGPGARPADGTSAPTCYGSVNFMNMQSNGWGVW
jgi:hypothetical protein